MSYSIPTEDINKDLFLQRPPEFNNKNRLMRTDKVYQCEIINIVPLTDMEKLFQIKFLDPIEAKIFNFLPG